MSNRHRRPRHSRSFNSNQRHHRPSPQLYSVGWYGPGGDEIEITVDLNDPGADPFLVDLIHRMTDNCPDCSGHHQKDNDHGRE